MARRRTNPEFERDLDRLMQRMERYLLDVQTETSYWCLRQVIQRTPVWEARDSDPPGYSKHTGGIAKNAWQISFEGPSNEGARAPSSSGTGSLNEGRARVGRLTNFREVWVTNNVPYITVLEFGGFPNPPKQGTGRTVGGFSTQAPEGMVRKTLREAPEAAEAIAKALFLKAFGV